MAVLAGLPRLFPLCAMAMEPFLDPDEPLSASFPAHLAATSYPLLATFSADYDLDAHSDRIGGSQPQYTDIFDMAGFEANGALPELNGEYPTL